MLNNLVNLKKKISEKNGLLLLLLLSTINRAVVVGNGTYPNLTLPFLPSLPHLTSPFLPNLTLNLTLGTDYDD